MRNEFHPSTFAPPLVWARLILANRGVSPRYWGRLAQILALSALVTPLRLAEWLRHSRKLARVRFAEPPLFVLGFARSGTTHLQNLLAHDPRYGFLTAYQMVVPTFSLIGRGRLKRLMDKGMQAQGDQTRPMDQVKITLDSPQEEDVAVSNTSHRSFVHALSFPGLARRLYERYALMGGGAAEEPLPERELRRWERDYLRVLRKMTLHAGGRPLLLRNTVSTGRVEHLLRLFPDAKFVHIVRNPYTVYPSVRHLYRTLLPLYRLDDYDWPEFEDLLAEMYVGVMKKYLADRALIPEGRLAEVRFEDLERDPLGELERVYGELDLPGWEAARPEVESYLQSLRGYRKNRFDFDPALLRRVEERWGFALREWNYAPPAGSGSTR